MKSIFDSSFKYRPSFETDVRKTFQRVRRREGRTPERSIGIQSQHATHVAVLPLEHFKRPRAD